MTRASDGQVQRFVDERMRVRAERIRDIWIAIKDDRDSIGDIYEAVNSNPTWTDQRGDNPPSLLTASDVLAINTFYYNTVTAWEADAQFPAIKRACVKKVGE